MRKKGIKAMGNNGIELERDGFKSRTGFILACIGSAVGMGNIWRFPYMVSAWGGMTFLIPYVLFVILIGSTGVIEEMALGRATKGGPIKAFGDCMQMRTGKRKAGEAIGFIPVLGSLALAMGYTVVVGWIFKYTYLAFSGKLSAMGNDMSAIGGMFGSTASAFGNNMWLIIAMVVTAVIMALGIAGGIEKANKVMMPLLFIMFVGLGIYIFTLPGSSAGYKYIFTLNPKGLLDIKLWIYAFGQAFFSLSIAGNGTVIYGSYLSDKENVVSSARNVAVFDTIAALLAAFVIIPGMAAGGAELSSGGPGLMFIYLVNVFNGMPGGKIVGIVFYVCVLFAGMSSLVNLYEAPVATIQEKLKLNRVASVGIIAVAGCVVSLVIQGIVSGWMDAVSIYICPLGAMLAAIMFFWVAGKKFAVDAVNAGAPDGDVPPLFPLALLRGTLQPADFGARRERPPQGRGDLQGFRACAAHGRGTHRLRIRHTQQQRHTMIAITDYDTGNLRSVANALRRIGAEFTVTSDVHLLRDPAFFVYSVFRVTFGDGKYCLLNVSFISIVVDQTTFQDDLTFIVGQFAQRQGKRVRRTRSHSQRIVL